MRAHRSFWNADSHDADTQVEMLLKLNELIGLPLDTELVLAPAETRPAIPSLEDSLAKVPSPNWKLRG